MLPLFSRASEEQKMRRVVDEIRISAVEFFEPGELVEELRAGRRARRIPTAVARKSAMEEVKPLEVMQLEIGRSNGP